MVVTVAMGKYTEVTTSYAIKEEKVNGPLTSHIVIGTPGTMSDYIKRRILDPSEVKVFVLDEADNMLEMDGGLGDQTLRIKKCGAVSLHIYLGLLTMRIFLSSIS